MMNGFAKLYDLRAEIEEERIKNPKKHEAKKSESGPDPKKMTGMEYMHYLERTSGGRI